MKPHIGADDAVGLLHSVATTRANEADINVAERLLHGDEREVRADAGYRGLAENTNRWYVLLGLANLLIGRRYLVA